MSKKTVCDLQRVLESLHDVEIGLEVADYLVGDEQHAQIPGALCGLPEQFFVCDDGENIDLALYVDPEILETVRRHPPQKQLHHGNFEAFCIALEGVSHFITLAWRAQREWPITGLELEIQAEVDKFAVSWLLLAEQGTCLRRSSKMLLQRLFVHTSIRQEVDEESVARYEISTRIAHAFCESMIQTREPAAIQAQVRSYFRTGLSEKMRLHVAR